MSEIKDYLVDVKYHEFSEESTLIECGMETAFLTEYNWALVVEEEGLSEYDIFENAISNNSIKEDAILLAEASAKGLPDKFAKKLQHTWSYLEGIFAKFVTELKATYDRNRFLASKEGRDRIALGAKTLQAQGATVHGYLITADNGGLKEMKDFYDKFNDINKKLNDIILKGKDKAELEALLKEVESLKNKGQVVSKLGREDDWKITANVVENAEKNFINYLSAKKSAKSLYNYTRDLTNVMISNIKSLKKVNGKEVDSFVNDYAKAYNKILACISILNACYLSMLKQDYNTNCKIILKCYNAGGRALKNVKESEITGTDAVTFTTESLSSIFID